MSMSERASGGQMTGLAVAVGSASSDEALQPRLP